MGGPNSKGKTMVSDKKGHLSRPIEHSHLLKNPVKSDRFEYFSVSALDLLTNKQPSCVHPTTKPNSDQPECGKPGVPLGSPGYRTDRDQ